MTNGKSKVPVNLDNYPSLKQLAEGNKNEFLQILKSIFETMNEFIAVDAHKTSEEYFGVKLQDLLKEMLAAVFDHKGMMSYLPNTSNGEALSEMYGHALNPLHAAFSKQGLMDHSGTEITFEEKFGMTEEEFSIKRWLQGLMFWSYYGDLPALAQHLALNDYSLIEEEKHENIAKLIEIRPVLAYQKSIGILPGKLYPDTGFFDCGDLQDPDNATDCQACKHPDSLISLGTESVCIHCKGAFRE